MSVKCLMDFNSHLLAQAKGGHSYWGNRIIDYY